MPSKAKELEVQEEPNATEDEQGGVTKSTVTTTADKVTTVTTTITVKTAIQTQKWQEAARD